MSSTIGPLDLVLSDFDDVMDREIENTSLCSSPIFTRKDTIDTPMDEFSLDRLELSTIVSPEEVARDPLYYANRLSVLGARIVALESVFRQVTQGNVLAALEPPMSPEQSPTERWYPSPCLTPPGKKRRSKCSVDERGHKSRREIVP